MHCRLWTVLCTLSLGLARWELKGQATRRPEGKGETSPSALFFPLQPHDVDLHAPGPSLCLGLCQCHPGQVLLLQWRVWKGRRRAILPLRPPAGRAHHSHPCPGQQPLYCGSPGALWPGVERLRGWQAGRPGGDLSAPRGVSDRGVWVIHLTMWTFMLLGLLCASASASAIQARSSSYNGEYGSGGGERFSHSGHQLEGPITAIRVRVNSLYIVGLQVRYGKVWSDYVGGKLGDLEEIFLHPGESVIQVSGKYKYYLRKLVFVTDKGRYLSFGKDTGTSFNAVPLHPNTVLRFISGRAGLFVNAIGLHWDNYPRNC
nr:zymogen granule membrane protein 16 isoform X2 [Oryctolagus cuniculus]